MRVLDLPRRRYSVPETIMRKYRLRQRAESNTSSSSEECRRRRCADKSIQTSPRESIGRTSSLPFLATPSPCVWSYATSDCQTVSDRTTSTQDSTLSVPSTTPESYAALFRTEEAATQVSFPERTDRTTSVTGLQPDRTEDTVLDIAVSIETDMSDETVVEANRRRGESENKEEEKVNTACQTGNHALFKVPEINVFKDSSDSQSDDKPLQMKEQCSQVIMAEISEEMRPIEFRDRLRTDMACTGSNYDEFPIENSVIPRYSAIPRTNSMIVNTSSIDYSSDSELSLTDSLEDPDEFRPSRLRKQSKHDQRMVRGEVTMEQERKRLPKSKDAYAYFLSLTGEEEIIREYTIPEWLRNRLRKREQEIKKEYEDKLVRHQQYALHRRRKKIVRRVRRVNLHSSDEKSNRHETNTAGPFMKHEKMAIFQECPNNNNINKNNFNPGPSTKNASMRLVNGNNMGFEPKIDNIQRNKFNNNHCNNNNNGNDNNGREQNQRLKQTETSKSSNANPNLVQISEIIKIEMSDNLKTIITKEKQINLASEMSLKKTTSETIKEELSNTTKSIMTKNCENYYKTEPTNMNILQSTSEIETKEDSSLFTATQEIDTKEQDRKPNKIEKDYLRIPEVKQEIATSDSNTTAKNVTSPIKPTTSTTIQNEISHRKIELDRSIADVLITALEENTRARQMLMRTSETITFSEEQDGQSKTFVDQGSQKNETENEVQPPKSRSHGVQTEEYKDDIIDTVERSDISCNTEPYLVSIYVQTSDIHDQEDSDNSESDTYEVDMEIGSYDEAESSVDDPITDASLRMVDKACNTVESKSISTQTNVSILQSDDIINRLKKEKGDKKKDVQFPPQVIKQIITGTGEYKTVDVQSSRKSKDGKHKKNKELNKGKINKGTNTDEQESVTENNKNINNYNSDTVFNSTPQTPYCKNIFSSKSHKKKSQVLELNVPVCTCHMCTLQRISPRGDLSKSKIPQGKKSTDSREERKQAPKFTIRRSNLTGQIPKFRMFEAIPEEKNSSTESIPEDKLIQEKSNASTIEKREMGVLTEPHLVDQIIQVSSNNVNAATNTEPSVPCTNRTAEATQTSDQPKRKSNLVIGRFRSENRESPMLVRQYKGRASLSAGHVEGQEELLTLSKGWINFYLLRDNLEFSDSNGEEASMCQTQVTETRRRIQTVEKEEDKIEEYTVEIHATPESESKNIGRGRVTLPEINTSSSSSTPERDKKKSSIPAVETLPGVKKSKRTKRSQINLTREAITELGTRSRGEQEKMSSRAVEVACSEQSISSITSSTVILSESPPPQQLKLPERRSHHRHRVHRSLNHVNNGSNWTVTVAGSSGSGNDPPPDVEMKLTFGKQGKKQENGMHQYQYIRTKRQDPMIEEFAHMSRNEKHNQLEYTLQTNHHPKSSYERTRGGTARDNFSYEEDYINRLSSRRSKYSTEDGSETTGDLHVTGLAITPEKKPRVPTQSERDILRPQRYKFTR
ncbi:uncharacterized protein [Halyomorpha halys]|nr:putative mediator of RNA polymerase II transcription subunit 26 isoform X2 [Halyomorpha halys]XP_024215201.1 putative mediator of RNA polymerase II transcription subunit 26 isoform X2 [Halyomorpha halys]XP_024215202.1 putative mediator of RNA polymerase II transcription subunit 26 isoform X2 [Halyomorpha halys]XP_024215203.1 putative mediator of RNA polymerase II transcription subunit 26 isoform X2 [Halyomorpha halys]XP_024215204.1 putative mediator of RNA polymerase II transcription subunit